jgi:hypothetical protein
MIFSRGAKDGHLGQFVAINTSGAMVGGNSDSTRRRAAAAAMSGLRKASSS